MKHFKVGDVVVTNVKYALSGPNLQMIPKGTLLTIIDIDESRVEWSSKRITFFFNGKLCNIISPEHPIREEQWSGLRRLNMLENKQ